MPEINEKMKAAQFKPGQSGNPKGRPPNRVRDFKIRILGKKKAKAFFGISETEISEWYEVLITMDLPSLKVLAQDDTAPALVRTYARAIIFDMNGGKTSTIDRISEKLYGKAVQRMELTGADGADLLPARTLTKQEARELLEDLEKEY